MVAVGQHFKRVTQFLTSVIVSLGCLGGITTLQSSRLSTLRTTLSNDPVVLKTEVARAQAQLRATAKLPDFGFRNLIAGWNFMRFLQYFGDQEARSRTGYSLTPEYFRLIVDKDPRYLPSYFYLSPANTLYAGRPDITVELLSQGLRAYTPELNPDGYYLWIYKGVDQLLFLNQPHEAAKAYERAAIWAELSTSPESKTRAASARESARYLARNPGSKRVQASAWGMILTNAVDQASQKLAIQKITQLGGKVTIIRQGGMQSVSVQLPEDN
jgi:hypothetical protein